MEVRLQLSSGSERAFLLSEGDQVQVTRAEGDCEPAEDNAVFDSRVSRLNRLEFVFVSTGSL